MKIEIDDRHIDEQVTKGDKLSNSVIDQYVGVILPCRSTGSSLG